MSMAVSGVLVLGVFLLSALTLIGTLVDVGNAQGVSLHESSDTLGARLATLISITGISTSDGGSWTEVTVTVDNPGSTPVTSFSDMDVLIRYTTSTGDLTVGRLKYATGTPSDNEWSVCSGNPVTCAISPDAHNPNIWDPDEEATLSLRLAPEVQAGTTGTVVVVTPVGVSDLANFAY